MHNHLHQVVAIVEVVVHGPLSVICQPHIKVVTIFFCQVRVTYAVLILSLPCNGRQRIVIIRQRVIILVVKVNIKFFCRRRIFLLAEIPLRKDTRIYSVFP